MAEKTKIQWCDHTFNPWRGCTKVSAGCTNCYADTLSKRNPGVLGVWGPQGTRVVAAEAKWKEPIKWNKRAEWFCPTCQTFCMEWDGMCGGCANPCRKPVGSERPRVFCASIADVFEDWLGEMVNAQGECLLANNWYPRLGVGSGDRLTMSDVRKRLADLITATPNLDWLILTKRPQNLAWFIDDHMWGSIDKHVVIPRNVWLGTSIENQATADERIPHLLKAPAKVRFLNVEPMLEQVDLSRWLRCPVCEGSGTVYEGHDYATELVGCQCQGEKPIHWVIVGGESGYGARRFDLAWARSLRDQCQAAGVAFFLKQTGAHPTDTEYLNTASDVRGQVVGLKLADKKGGDLTEWPSDLQIRDFPSMEATL